ncbi:MAG: GNAT family N-acetyltransferase [Planctomycetaceae bacterium]|nr:GNAT family N-acetyltransferase [Planctomycetaceae bacterium]
MDNFVVSYRIFHNSDPPNVLRLWHNSNLGPCAAEGFPCDILELFVFSQPFFKKAGFIVAQVGDRLAGFVHASFGPTDDESQLNRSHGIICGLLVHPEFRRQGIGRRLTELAEDFLRQKGATTVVAGAGLDQSGFYNGIYGGLAASGFSAATAPWQEFMKATGYEPSAVTQVLQRDLANSQDPVSSRLIRHRRRLNMVITDRVGNQSWWWHVRFGHLDALRFELCERDDDTLVASGQIIGLDVYVPKWGVRAVGLRDIHVPESQRRKGYGLSLIVEVCRRLREQSIQIVEAQLDQQNSAAHELFRNARFDIVHDLLTFRKTL